MSELIFEVSGVRMPYHFFSSPALGADIQDVKTPEEGFTLLRAFQKANTLFNFLIKIWCDNKNSKDIDAETAADSKVYVDITDYPKNTVYMEISDDYLWINFPYVFDDNKTRADYFKSAYWRSPVTPHAFYCLLRHNIDHIPKRSTNEYHENSEYAQHVALAPKLDAFAETLIPKDTEEAEDSDDSDVSNDSEGCT